MASDKDRVEDRQDKQYRKVERERPDLLTRQSREPKKPDELDDNFGSRRSKRSDVPSTRSSRRHDTPDEAPPATGIFNKGSEPEWMSGGEIELSQEADDATGKTVDDFERWKQSMKKNDGSGDVGLPPLPDQSLTASTAFDSRGAEEVAKDVRPPPGFESAKAESPDPSLLSRIFGSGPTTDKTDDTTAPAPPNTFTPNLSASSQSNSSQLKSSGSSKFSKFFNQSQDSSSSPVDVGAHTKGHTEYHAPMTESADLFSSMTKPAGNKDDAEGFERILAMLSSQTAPEQQSANTQRSLRQQPPPSQPTISSAPYQTGVEQQRVAMYADHYDDIIHQGQNPGRAADPIQPYRGTGYGQSSRAVTGPMLPDRYQEQRLKSPERQVLPAMRDSSGSGSILSNHTQNQDFFSSLLNQSSANHSSHQFPSPPNDRFGAPPGSYPLPGKVSPPSQRYSSTSQGNQYDPRDIQAARNAYGFASSNEDQRVQFLRQQQGQQTTHQGSRQLPRDASELDFLNQLMQEQRLGANPRDPIYHHNSGPGSLDNQYGSQGRPAPQGYVTGVGSRPGPGWNGQFEIDPRIPNASAQYRP